MKSASCVVWVALWVLIAAHLVASTTEFRSHSHNDYLQPEPLALAIGARMGSVEADVWLVGGELLVAHDRNEIAAGRTLRALYLEPLRRHIEASGGAVYPDGGPALVLLIDIKSEADDTYAAIERELNAYRGMLTANRDGQVRPGAVRVLISGNVPKAALSAQPERLASVDGRPADLDGGLPAGTAPLISESWAKLFRWEGRGAMPEAERTVLRQLAERCHAQGRQLHLWAAPDTEDSWREQADAGVDFINTDQPARLHAFLISRP